jgi:hypothetical protein
MSEKILWADERTDLNTLYNWTKANKPYKSIGFGRVCSGRRWFWCAAQDLRPETEKFGWADSEHEAFVAARTNVIEIARGKAASVSISHDLAAHKLQELNEAKRAARPASEGNGSRPVEYLYGQSLSGDWVRFFPDPNQEDTQRGSITRAAPNPSAVAPPRSGDHPASGS